MTRLTTLPLIAMLGCLATTATAEIEDGLYGAALPSDAVFVRHVGEVTEPLTAFGHVFAPDDLQDATYAAISASALEGAAPGGFYTFVDGASSAIAEPAREDASKVYLFLLNLDLPEARLVVDGNGPEVIAGTGQGRIGARGVNPIAVTLAVESGQDSQSFELVLRRGVNLTFLVENGAARVIEHRFGPVIAVD